jgi:hypothetical protein
MLWITINTHQIVKGIFITRIISLIIFSPLLWNMSPECSAALFSSLDTEFRMYMEGDLYAVDLGGDSLEYNLPIQLEARIYDPIRGEYVEDGPSYTPPFQQPNPRPTGSVIPELNPVELPPGSIIPELKPVEHPPHYPKPDAVEPSIQPPKPDLPVMKPPVGPPKPPAMEPPVLEQPLRPPVMEQPNVQPVRPPGPEQPNIGYHKYKLPVSEEQGVELGEGSNSNAASSKITLPIELEALSTEQRNFAANYWDKQYSYQQVMNEIRKAKNIPATWREVEPELTRQRDELWREIVELRVYANNNYNLEKVGDIRDLVAVVTGNRFR